MHSTQLLSCAVRYYPAVENSFFDAVLVVIPFFVQIFILKNEAKLGCPKPIFFLSDCFPLRGGLLMENNLTSHFIYYIHKQLSKNQHLLDIEESTFLNVHKPGNQRGHSRGQCMRLPLQRGWNKNSFGLRGFVADGGCNTTNTNATNEQIQALVRFLISHQTATAFDL